jgi:hypothetical protein
MEPRPRRTGARAPRTGSPHWGAVAAVLAAGCTQDFSVFDTHGPSNTKDATAAAAGGKTDASASGGRAGSGGGGGSSSGGTSTSGGAAGATSSGGTPGTGGRGSGGVQSNGGAAGAGGRAATGGTPGTGGSKADAGPPTCDTTFGTLPGYTLCTQTATTCRFAATVGAGACRVLCTSRRSACFDQDGNDTAAACTVTVAADTCDTPRTHAICVCGR